MFEIANIMKDDYIDILISENENRKIIKFPYSRIFVDVERFEKNEIMDEIGMGIFYTNDHNLKNIRFNFDKKKLIKYYHNHHNKLNLITKKLLKTQENVTIIDLHSYSNNPLKYELNKNQDRPDICIGIDEYHLDEKQIDDLIYKIKALNYSYKINEPFSGTMIPSKFYLKDKRVNGFMIEINKNVFKNDLKKIKKLISWIM